MMARIIQGRLTRTLAHLMIGFEIVTIPRSNLECSQDDTCCMECYGVSKEVIAGLVGCGGKISVVEVRDNFPEIEFGDKGPYPDLDWNST